ncbi:hypothetical protein [Prosthecomicrobium pneumaticum]|uniref:Carboxypeptidase regulatory-like domain-containing protein n=1 Tax=Prosthecomicrobium pneumaticum TaxID=81895 RepID=A0A7W9FPG4_9HYPH|nr:hypothetical protein [Prosthecomicrobium pneumaticum]MBB5754368.1 hypothetical protein [Prosthecomicrobium pneumaticum]
MRRRISIGTKAAALLAAAMLVAIPSLHAQDALPLPPADVPDGAAPADPMALTPLQGGLPAPMMTAPPPAAPAPPRGEAAAPPPAALPPAAAPPAAATAPAAAPIGNLTLEARLTEDGRSVPADVIWRVFSQTPGGDGRLPLVKEETGGIVTLAVEPGRYVVHAAYGRAGAAKQITVGGTAVHDTLVLNAGGLKLSAMVGSDKTVNGDEASFDIFAEEQSDAGERRLIVPRVHPNRVVRLNAATYHVVGRYGNANAVVRADIRVEPGKLTEATLYQQAARMTLKLVAERGGEALANTNWSVVTPGGDTVFDSVGAFPAVVLAVGDYTAIAKHDDKIYERSFSVESGIDREIEVLAK